MSNTFGDRLRAALKDAGYTQKSATEKLGLSKNAITNYVGGRIPDALILYKLAELCSVSMEWLLTGEESYQSDRKEVEMVSESKVGSYSVNTSILDKFEQLTKEEQTKIEGIIEGFLLAREMHSDKRTTSSNSTNGEEAATSETA